MKCHDCVTYTDHKMQPRLHKDGYCSAHWHFHFDGMTNHERMLEKKKLRELRKVFNEGLQSQTTA